MILLKVAVNKNRGKALSDRRLRCSVETPRLSEEMLNKHAKKFDTFC